MKKDWENFWKDKNVKTTWSKKRVISILGKHAKGNVLEVGCGSGFYSKYFVDHGCKVVALDYSKKALEMTASLDERIVVKEGNALHMPFRSGTFDIIFSDGLIEHFKKPEQLLKEFKRVLKPKGKLITFVPNKFSYWIFVKPFIMKDITEHKTTLSELIKLHEKSGFSIIESGGISVLPIKYSPEFLGRRFGRLLYVITKK